jgi:hypothetical protein
MKKLHTVYITTSLSILLTPFVVMGQVAVPPQPAVPTENTPTSVQQTCERITQKVDARVARFTEVSQAHTTRVEKTLETLRSISDKLKARGIDTTALDGQITVLIEKYTKVQADKQAFISKLEESKQFTCGASQGQFKSKVSEARALQVIVVTGTKDIHAQVRSIRDSIRTISTQIATSTSTSTPTQTQ